MLIFGDRFPDFRAEVAWEVWAEGAVRDTVPDRAGADEAFAAIQPFCAGGKTARASEARWHDEFSSAFALLFCRKFGERFVILCSGGAPGRTGVAVYAAAADI